MAPIQLEDLLIPASVTLLHSYQLSKFAMRVGSSRQKFKVPYPAITGDENFMRIFRAQQNTIEFTPIFFPVLWAASLFFHPVPAAIGGLVYWYGRSMYFEGYAKDVKERLPGFMLCVKAIKALLLMSFTGIVHTGLVTYAEVNLKQMVMDRFVA